jgi:putative transposase
MPVRKRLHITGPAAVFVTTAVKDWTPIFTDPTLGREVALQLRETSSHFEASILAYVIMPSHVHALLGLKRIEELSRLMQAFKALTTSRVMPLLTLEQRTQFGKHRKFQFWRPRFDDLIIWSEDQFRTKTEYIHNNPVKAGLCERGQDYEFSSARDWLLGEAGTIPVDKSWSWQRSR